MSDDTFVAKVPDGYERLKVMRHATVQAASVSEAPPAESPAAKGAKPKKP